MVESVSTPPAVSSMHRSSFLGAVFAHDNNTNATTPAHTDENRNENPNQDQNPNEQEQQPRSRPRPRPRREQVESSEAPSARALSGLQPPPTDATRSSYMTTSTTSRISGLSDFPAPPKNHHPLPHPYQHTGNIENSEDVTVVMRPTQQQEETQNSHPTTAGHMSLLTSYFHEAMAESESRAQSRTSDVEQESPTLMLAALEECIQTEHGRS